MTRSPALSLPALVLVVVVVGGCEVEASLGSHDGGADATTATCHAPADAGTCVACQAASCCEPFAACAAAATCPCLVDCVLHGHALDACTTHCGGADHGEHAPLLDCARTHCACP